jgi:hypothetical protein
VLENRVLRKIFGPSWKKWESGESCVKKAYELCLSSIVIRVIKPKRKRWAGNLEHMWEKRNIACFGGENGIPCTWKTHIKLVMEFRDFENGNCKNKLQRKTDKHDVGNTKKNKRKKKKGRKENKPYK